MMLFLHFNNKITKNKGEKIEIYHRIFKRNISVNIHIRATKVCSFFVLVKKCKNNKLKYYKNSNGKE